MESMDDYKEELEASFRRIREGDILTGTVIDVNEEGVTLDLKYYAPGFISAEEMSSDPDFSLAEAVHVGDTTAQATFFSPAGKPMKSRHGRSSKR